MIYKAITFFLAGVLCVHAESLVLDGSQTEREFEGIGALSAGASSRLLIDYPEPQRSEILDFLFKPNFGASLQHLKVEIGGDVDSTDGTEPSIARTREEFENPKLEYFQRGYEWWLMKEAKKRNPNIIFDVLPWGAPGWVGNGNFYSQDNADFIVAFIKGAKTHHDLDISYCGIWNERKYNVEWIKLLRKTLDANGLKDVKIVAADEVNKWTIADQMAKDPELRDAIHVIGSHYAKFKSTPVALSLGKPVWSSEDGSVDGAWEPTVRARWSQPLPEAYNRNYVGGKMTKTIVWSPIASYYPIMPIAGCGLMSAGEPWSGHYEVKPAIWMTAHTTQFIQPGWHYLGGDACRMLAGGGSVVAAVSPDQKNYSFVIETMGAKEPQTLSFTLADNLAETPLAVWKSTKDEQMVRLDDLPVTGRAFNLPVEPGVMYSLTTTRGQNKGRAPEAPASSPLPLPYLETFDAYEARKTPRYLSDFYGAFETSGTAVGRACLQQIITTKGIPWAGDELPVTMVGNLGWKDYEVSCDVRFDFQKSATLYGRLVKARGKDKKPSGYALTVDASGAWKLLGAMDNQGKGNKGNQDMEDVQDTKRTEESPHTPLCEGKVEITPGTWHKLGLRMIGDRITPLLDGKPLGSAFDRAFKNGFVGIGCDWERVSFDNLSVVEAAGSEP